jgi:predicted nucleotidyltransferase
MKMITEKQIQKLTSIIVEETDADSVYLFGSYATGSINKDSDIDLLVVVNKELKKETRRNTISALGLKTATPDLFFPKDFKLYSTKEFEALKNDKYSFLYQILQSAKLLYARRTK